jgi:hypothetical protein
MPDFLKMLQHFQKLPNLGIYPDLKSEAYKTTQSYPVTNIHTIYFKGIFQPFELGGETILIRSAVKH